MGLEYIHFNSIKSGMKKFELRVNDEKRKKVDINDFISFTNGLGESVKTQVIQISEYNSFPDAINLVGYEKLLPGTVGVDSNEKAIKYYHSIVSGKGQTYEALAKAQGVVLFELLLCRN